MINCPWDGFKIEEEIGEGAYGTVYRVCCGDRDLAMKYVRIPRSDKEAALLSRRLGGMDKAKAYYRGAAEKFAEETRLLQQFRDHPNIVSIEDFKMQETETGFEIFILMECLKSLPEYQTTHLMDEKAAVHLGLDVCDALIACRKASIIHRDLKPDNILVTEDGTFKICDFGVAKHLEKTFTENSVKGTFTFMAPEVYHGKKYDHRADIYSLGLILYSLMNRGREPFLSSEKRMIGYKDKEDAMNRRMNGEALPLPAEASPELAQILLKACAYYPEKRYMAAEDLKKDLLSLQAGTYKKKKQNSNKYGRRTKAFYQKAAAALILAAIVLAGLSKPAGYAWREHFVDLCDEKIKAQLLEDYGFSSGARLNGNGTLYIESANDLYCCKGSGNYPWMNHKQDIKKIVFGENVTRLQLYEMEYEYGDEDNQDEYMSFAEGELVCPPNVGIFASCTNLKEVVIEAGSFDIMFPDPFAGDTALTEISCPEDADIYVEVGALTDTPWLAAEGYRILGSTLVRYNGQEEVLDDIPENVRRLNDSCFTGDDRIKKIILPEGLVCIDAGTFDFCNTLEELEIPESVQIIGEDAFATCPNLKTINLLPENGFYLMDNGILYDTGRKTLLWCSPDYEGVFEIPETVEAVYRRAFDYCMSMTGLIIPDRPVMQDLTFPKHAPDFNRITISGENPAFTLENGIIYDKGKTRLLFCPRDYKGEVEVPESVTYIMEYAFAGCSDVTEVQLPENLISIEEGTFKNCTGLTSVTLPGRQLGFIGSWAFEGCENLTDIYYEGSQEQWQVITTRQPRGTGVDEEKTVIHYSE